ncbi:MAG TPA: hypothetical protein VNF68_06040 [Candidatus Baltobacteraceae bacterium]|nr:hypothetical protein [Candidatus Baltobacteraceae bacterium]
MDKRILGALAFSLVATLAACGGGGGGGPTPPTTPPTIVPTATPCPSGYTGTAPNCVAAQTTTTATGMVVDDGTGAPLAGVPVKLEPWAPCGATPPPTTITPENDGCPTPLPSPQATTAADGTFTLGNAPNGHYLLVIGTDSTASSGTVQATVHDNVTLTGGAQTLLAPTLKAIPTVTPPAWETNGDYRIATLNATTELPCFQAWQSERATNGLAAGTNDEWLIENARSIQLARYSGGLPVIPVVDANTLTSGESSNSGGVSCGVSLLQTFTFAGGFPEATDPRTEWFGGQYLPYATPYNATHVSAIGFAEFPVDPRSFTDPNVPVWP